MLGPLLEVEMSKKRTPLWREAHLEVKMYKAHHSRTIFGSCRKSARRCGAKHISKSKVSKTDVLGALLEVDMPKKCTPLWCEEHFEVKSAKNWGGRGKGLCTLSTVSKPWRFCSSFNYNPHYTTVHYITLQLHLQPCTTCWMVSKFVHRHLLASASCLIAWNLTRVAKSLGSTYLITSHSRPCLIMFSRLAGRSATTPDFQSCWICWRVDTVETPSSIRVSPSVSQISKIRVLAWSDCPQEPLRNSALSCPLRFQSLAGLQAKNDTYTLEAMPLESWNLT